MTFAIHTFCFGGRTCCDRPMQERGPAPLAVHYHVLMSDRNTALQPPETAHKVIPWTIFSGSDISNSEWNASRTSVYLDRARWFILSRIITETQNCPTDPLQEINELERLEALY